MMKPAAEEIFENSFLPENVLAAETKEIKKNKFTDLPSSAGFVLFADNQNLPIALLTTANIRRTVKNKLAEQQEKTKRADLKSITAKIYYTVCPCKFRLAIKHLEAVKKIYGQNYKDHFTLISPWYLTVNPNDKIPFFCVTRKPLFKNGEKILGPFPTQKSASVFMNTLQDVFRLCRKSELANYSEQAKSCPYLQMDACVGVCAGKISSEDYRNIIEDAFSAGDEPEKTIDNFNAEMQTAAKELSFEKAALLRKRIEKLCALKKPNYRWTSDLKKLKIVHIDKSGKIKPEGSKTKEQTYAVFAMNFFQIIDLGDFLRDKPEIINESIKKRMENLSESPDCDTLERFSIVTYFLYRSNPSGVWQKIHDKFDFTEAMTKTS